MNVLRSLRNHVGPLACGYGVIGKDYLRGMQILVAGVGVVHLLDLALALMAWLFRDVARFEKLLTDNTASVFLVTWMVVGYLAGLGLAADEEAGEGRSLLEQLPAPIWRFYWLKAVAGMLIVASFLPVTSAFYLVNYILAPAGRPLVLDVMGELLAGGNGFVVLLVLGLTFAGQTWATLVPKNPIMAACAGAVAMALVCGGVMVTGDMGRVSDERALLRASLAAFAVGAVGLLVAVRFWSVPVRDRQGFLELIGIQITVPEGRLNPPWKRQFYLPTGVGLVLPPLGWFAELYRVDPVNGYASTLILGALIAAIAGTVHGALCIHPPEHNGTRFFLHYQPIPWTRFVLRRALVHGVLAGLWGAVAGLPAGLLANNWFIVGLMAAVGAMAGLFAMAYAACFENRIVVALVTFISAIPIGWALAMVSLYGGVVEGIWVAFWSLVVPFGIAVILNDAARLREASDSKRQAVGLLTLLQTFGCLPFLILCSPIDLWIILFP